MPKTLYLIAGANGCGKTTLTKELLKSDKELVWLNSDEIAEAMNDELGITSGRVLMIQLNDALAKKQSVVLESTISGKYHEGVIEKFQKAKYEVIFVYVFLDSLEQNLARIKQRVELGGHNVPEDAVKRRFYRSVKNFWSVCKLVDKWELYYNGENNYELIARGKGEMLEIIDDVIYNAFKKGSK